MDSVLLSLVQIPPAVDALWDYLNDQDFTVLVGGSVRDLLQGLPPHDWDFATALPVERVQALAEAGGYSILPTGIAFGTVMIVVATTPTPLTVEVTTFRSDGRYVDGRHPQSVRFTRSLKEDVKRRDFTVNALALTREGTLVDLVGGVHDVSQQTLRAVGDAFSRFQEDPLRMWRAVRFVGYGFTPDATVTEAIQRLKALTAFVSRERIQQELWRLLDTPHFTNALQYADQTGLLSLIWPEWEATRNFNQRNPHHNKPVHAHLLATAAAGPTPLFRLTGLLHDIAKPSCFVLDTKGIGHFYDHDHVGAQYAQDMLTRLRFPKQTILTITTLIDQHMFPWDDAGDATIRRMIRKYGIDMVQNLLILRQMDVMGASDHPWEYAESVTERVRSCAQQMEERGRVCITGHEVMKWLGIGPSPRVGEVLRECQAWVDADPTCNSPTILKSRILEVFGSDVHELV